MGGRYVFAAGLAVASVFATGGCDDAAVTTRDPTATALAPTSTVQVAATELTIGDCLSGLVIGARERIEIASVAVVSCDRAHELEVFATFPVGDAEFPDTEPGVYPGQQRVVAVADAGCADRLTELGDDESFGIITLWPTPASWAQGDRAMVCAAYPDDGRARFDGRQLLADEDDAPDE